MFELLIIKAMCNTQNLLAVFLDLKKLNSKSTMSRGSYDA